MPVAFQDRFGTQTRLPGVDGPVDFVRLAALEERGLGRVAHLPFSLKVLLESLVRHCNGLEVREEDVLAALRVATAGAGRAEIPFLPARIVLQDFTGVPALVDLAALRAAVARLGGDPARVEPLLPAELVVDHSVQVDVHGTPEALVANMRLEFERNRERYALLKWGRQAFRTFRVVPPGVGIVHQVNLESLARVVFHEPRGDGILAWPDSVLGTDSHTPMVNGLGVVGWGVGGIEAEAAMLGQPLSMLWPEVLGVRLTGVLPPGTTATDLALTITQVLRRKGVVGRFVEFFGPGLSSMSLADRATISNMAPEYGATIAYFPIDAESLAYLRRTGRDDAHVSLVEAYARAQGIFRTDDTPDPLFSEVLNLDLATIEPSLAGPKRPQDRVPLSGLQADLRRALVAPVAERGFGLAPEALGTRVALEVNGRPTVLAHGSVAIAAITSCTNTSNPGVMLMAGLVARKAVERGLTVPAHVKTSLAPGSRVVTEYLAHAGLLPALERLGFHVVGYGCTTCIGNSGPLPEPVARAVQDGALVVAAVLSGNRNFEGRINPLTRAAWLASPPLVVAYALAGTVDVDLTTEPLATDPSGAPVYLAELWPSAEEVRERVALAEDPAVYRRLYRDLDAFNPDWNAIPEASSLLFDWRPDSTYIREPPFLVNLPSLPAPIGPVEDARVLALLGDSITTDHISPAGAIAPDGPAGRHLRSLGVAPRDFNSYGARRGNHEVMVRGTLANIRLRNRLVPGTEGGVTVHHPTGDVLSIHEASGRYLEAGVPLLLIAGREYGSGSSRDWAAKGTALLGVRAVLAESYERIHRANLVGMGVVPLQFRPGESAASLGLDGRERYRVALHDRLSPHEEVEVEARGDGRAPVRFRVILRVDTPAEMQVLRHGGVLPAVLRRMIEPTRP